jgi:hypothetical protein
MKRNKSSQGQNQKTASASRPTATADLNQNSKSQRRDNIVSKSHDTLEDRGSRQMKTIYDSQTLFRICALM